MPQDEWQNAAKLLNWISHDSGNVVKVLHGEDNVISLIFIQRKQQRELYKKYGEVVELDGTYKILKLSMALYTILVEDNYGIGQLFAYFFVKEETTESIMEGLSIFAAVSLKKLLLCYINCFHNLH